LGQGKYFVIEGDEYDSAFFDKGPKFLHYRPRVALFTSLEYDHADIYPDLASVRDQFLRFVELLPPDGLVMVCEQYADAVEIARKAPCKVETYGFGKEADWVGVIKESEGRTATMEIHGHGRHMGSYFLPVLGRHNGLNVLGSLGLLHHLGVRPESFERGLESFEGVRRRQEIAGEVRGVLLIDDFAHHPTAVRETLVAVRKHYPGRRVLAVFEPRTHTSRRSTFQREYAAAFLSADVALCAPIYRGETVPPEDRFSPAAWVEDLRKGGVEAHCFEDAVGLERGLTETCRPGDLVLFMSSGSLSDLIGCLKTRLERGDCI
jgi:UDP-N-acetylmuramate: L-alanyl-gamma-D-glutamyl-meso-diaminopimelate ligase